MTGPRTIFEKIWQSHVVDTQDDGTCLIYVDRHLVHEVTSAQAFEGLRSAGHRVRRPAATLAVADHNVPTTDRSGGIEDPESRIQVEALEANVAEAGIAYFSMADARQGIVHIIGPEQGFTLPGTTIVCGDSHTSTHGAFGALAFGIGTSEVEHVLATQTLLQKPAKSMRIAVEGDLPFGVGAKDLILAVIGTIGIGAGTGHVIEYAGKTVRALSMEGRMTMCNMSIEAGARAGLVAPDDTTFRYLKGRAMAPKGAAWEAAVAHWRTLPSDDGATYGHRRRDRCLRYRAPGHLGHQSSGGAADHRAGAGPGRRGGPDPAYGRGAHARLHGAHPRHAPRRDRDRHGLHRLVHQQPHRGPARRRGDRQGAPGGRRRRRPRGPPAPDW